MKFLLLILLQLQLSPLFPQNLFKVQQLADKSGYATYVSGIEVITVAHLVTAKMVVSTVNTKATPTKVTPRKVDKMKDVAILVSEVGRLEKVIPITSRPPVQGEDVFYLCATPKDDMIVIKGRVAGVSDYMLLVDGFGAPGCSGSPILNAAGEIMGLHSGSWLWHNDPDSQAFATPLVFGPLLKKGIK